MKLALAIFVTLGLGSAIALPPEFAGDRADSTCHLYELAGCCLVPPRVRLVPMGAREAPADCLRGVPQSGLVE
jgi:hypothetical protein